MKNWQNQINKAVKELQTVLIPGNRNVGLITGKQNLDMKHITQTARRNISEQLQRGELEEIHELGLIRCKNLEVK